MNATHFHKHYELYSGLHCGTLSTLIMRIEQAGCYQVAITTEHGNTQAFSNLMILCSNNISLIQALVHAKPRYEATIAYEELNLVVCAQVYGKLV